MPTAATGGIRKRALCLALPLSSILVSDDSAWGLLRDKLLPDALRGTSIVEAAGILVPLGNLGSSGELLDLSAPELSLGGVNPDCIFYQGTSTNGSWREQAQAPPSETTRQGHGRPKGTGVPKETRYWVCRWHTSGETKRQWQAKLYKGELFIWFWILRSSPYQIAGDAYFGCRWSSSHKKANSYGERIDLPSKAPVRDCAKSNPPRGHGLHFPIEATNSKY